MRPLLFSFIFALILPSAFGVGLLSPPTIEFSASNAVVRWVTDVTAGTRVQVSPPATFAADKVPGTQHSATLSGLQPGVTYTVVIGSARVHLATNVFTAAGSTTPTARSETKKNSATQTAPTVQKSAEADSAPPTRKIWGNPASLPDHFTRHGGDFHARDADDYARMSWEFFQRAKAEGLPAKMDADGVLRIFDPQSGTFASYNRNGTTKTFFKPGSRDYFERQPGRDLNLKTWK